jgi:hypothetical protein
MLRLIFFVLGLLATNVGINIQKQNKEVDKWKHTQGKILEIEVTGFDEDFINVRYKYTVMGREYIGDRFNVSNGSVANAEEKVKQYKVGTIVSVMYNPRNPRESALTKDHPAIPRFFIVVGVIFILFALFAPF